jgi:hypothetical protein
LHQCIRLVIGAACAPNVKIASSDLRIANAGGAPVGGIKPSKYSPVLGSWADRRGDAACTSVATSWATRRTIRSLWPAEARARVRLRPKLFAGDPCQLIRTNSIRQNSGDASVSDDERRTGFDRRSGKDRRSGVDTRSKGPERLRGRDFRLFERLLGVQLRALTRSVVMRTCSLPG